MKIENGKEVEVHYTLHVGSNAEGEIVEQTYGSEPMRFVFGQDPMLPKFEEAIQGLAAGEKFTIAIACADAYGQEDDEFFIEFPKSDFIDDDGQ